MQSKDVLMHVMDTQVNVISCEETQCPLQWSATSKTYCIDSPESEEEEKTYDKKNRFFVSQRNKSTSLALFNAANPHSSLVAFNIRFA
jgi:hypothetical protein